ncbi:MAG: glutaredoxin [Elusimicrobia bacterium RIFOXYA2_FULL_69_6]|nr:MAG: glutaredoxin [Elusimicrobia bacterium RIFOXYA2_FULL_69_6]
MKIEVFGPGCPKCANTEAVIKAVLAELGRQAEVVKISDITAIVDRGVMFTPAVMIDGKKVCEGKVPTADMVKGWLK